MKINQQVCPYRLDPRLVTLLQTEVNQADIKPDQAVTISFRDPSYSAEAGGYHPVEVRITANGAISYITDFSFAGIGPFAELVKEIDFDFGLRSFQHFGREHVLEDGAELFAVWQENFLAYYAGGIFEVTLTCE